MNTNPTLQDRAVEAAARFLEVRGYETLATGWKSPETRGAIDLVARDPESDFAESVGVRFDKISMIVVGEDRALLRHHINAFGEA